MNDRAGSSGNAEAGSRGVPISSAEAMSVDEIREWWTSDFRVHRQNTFLQILELIWRERPMPGEMPVRGVLAQGEIGGRPYDVSALAVKLGQPRTSVTRLIRHLESEDVVRGQMNGRRKELFLTDKGWRQMKNLWDEVDLLLDKFIIDQAKNI